MLEEYEYFEEDYALEDYGDIMQAGDVAVDVSSRAEIVNLLANDPTFFQEIVSNEIFLNKIVKNSAFCVALAKSSRAMTEIVKNPTVMDSIGRSEAFVMKVAERINGYDNGFDNYLYQHPQVNQLMIDMLNNFAAQKAFRQYATYNIELVGDDGNVVALADSRTNPDGSYEYFFDPVVARNNPNAKVRIAFAKAP